MSQLIYVCEAQTSRANRFQVFTRNSATLVLRGIIFESAHLAEHKLDLWAPGTSTANTYMKPECFFLKADSRTICMTWG